MSDLLDMLDALSARENPTTGNPDVRDTSTGDAIDKHDRCPDCGHLACGSCHAPGMVRSVFRTVDGWLTVASCKCGRLRWTALEPREGDFWLHHAPDVWGPIVPRPDVDAWMAGADRAEVLA
jgi:hypothetical protein